MVLSLCFVWELCEYIYEEGGGGERERHIIINYSIWKFIKWSVDIAPENEFAFSCVFLIPSVFLFTIN